LNTVTLYTTCKTIVKRSKALKVTHLVSSKSVADLPTVRISLVTPEIEITRMWVDAQRDGRPAEYRWRPLFNAAKFG